MSLLAHSASVKGGDPQLYSEHVENCRTLARTNAENVASYAKNDSGWDTWHPSIKVAAEWHDLGKLDEENQKALHSGRGEPLPYDHIDAGVAHALNSENPDLAAAWLIRAHHDPGLPSVIKENLKESFYLRGKRRGDEKNEAHEMLVRRNNTQLDSLVNQHLHTLGQKSYPPTPSKPKHGIGARIALSCIVDADHCDSARFDKFGSGEAVPTITPDPKWAERLTQLTDYIQKKQNERRGDIERNKMRQAFFEGCLSNVPVDSNLVSCEATVGLGKTTSVLAYLLRQAIVKNLRRVVIVAPFTNILRQTARTLSEALLLPGENTEDVILQHHHRAEFTDQRFRHLAVTWDSPIILTTAVQFFETLGSNHPSALRKMHRLPGSAILIDEAHASLPYDLWPQCFEWLRELSESWTCPTALVSGSQIRFWENSWGRPKNKKTLSIPEITPPEVAEFGHASESLRCRLEHKETPLSCISLSEIIERNLERKRNQLVILNTVHSAAGFAQAMAERLDAKKTSLKSRRVMHLSTLLSPSDRERILQEIELRTQSNYSGESWLLVATSCVEAGIDLDFHDGFREDSSITSLIQTSGRINRHGLFSDSVLTRISLASDPAFRPHPQFEVSSRILQSLFPYLKHNEESLSAITTAAARKEIEESSGICRSHRLSMHETEHEYPKVAELCKVIQSDTATVVINRKIADYLKQNHPVSQKELLDNSVQIWANKLHDLGLEIIQSRSSGELFYASEASYDSELLGLGRAILASSKSLQCSIIL